MLWLAAQGSPTIQEIKPRLTARATVVHRITKHLGTISHFYKKRKQPRFQMTEHKQIGQTPMHTCSCTQKRSLTLIVCIWPWSNNYVLEPCKTDHDVKLSLCNTSHLVTFLSRCRLPATKHIKREKNHKPQQLTVQHAPRPHSTSGQPSGNNAEQRVTSALPLAWWSLTSQFLIRWKFSTGKKEGKRILAKLREVKQHMGTERQTATRLLTALNPREGHRLSTNQLVILYIQVDGTACNIALIPMQEHKPWLNSTLKKKKKKYFQRKQKD